MVKKTITKATEGDKRQIISSAVEDAYREAEGGYAYLMDYDDTYAYFEIWERGEGYSTFRSTYTFNGTSAEISDDAEEVVRQTEYEVVEERDDLEKSILKTLGKFFGGSKDNEGLALIKQFQEEEMIAIEPLYIAANDTDLQGDSYTREEAETLVKNTNSAIEAGTLRASYFHKVWTDHFHYEKAWMNEVDCMIGDTFVPEGQPILKTQFTNKGAWEAKKAGKLAGPSIGARAEEVEEVGND